MKCGKPLPRYLRVAHWLHEQRCPLGSREVADAFGVSVKAISDDFAKIRRRTDIMEVHEQKICDNGVQKYLLHVLAIEPYVLDERRCPHPRGVEPEGLGSSLTWYDLLCRPWRQLIEMQQELD